MTKIIFIGLILLTGLQRDIKDDFNFPEEFYRVNLNTATVESIISVFGNKCTIDTTFLKDENDRTKGSHIYLAPTIGSIRVFYDNLNLTFTFFSRSDIEGPAFIHNRAGRMTKFRLVSMMTNRLSHYNFGNPVRLISSYKIHDLLSLYGPADSINQEAVFKIYYYSRPEFARKYEFLFLNSTGVLNNVIIKPLTQ